MEYGGLETTLHRMSSSHHVHVVPDLSYFHSLWTCGEEMLGNLAT